VTSDKNKEDRRQNTVDRRKKLEKWNVGMMGKAKTGTEENRYHESTKIDLVFYKPLFFVSSSFRVFVIYLVSCFFLLSTVFCILCFAQYSMAPSFHYSVL